VTHLLIGSCLEDGRDVRTGSKWNKTQELIAKGSKIAVLTEDEFYDKVESSLPPAERAAAQAARLGHAAAGKGMEGLDTAPSADAGFGAASKPLLAGVEAGAEASSAAIVPHSRAGAGAGAGAGVGAASSRGAAGAGGVAADALWVDRYKPRSFADLVGNQRELQALDGWLRDWESVHLHPHAAKPAGAGAGGAGASSAAAPKAPATKAASLTGARATAALLSGPPGIGKTTTAMLLAARHGYDVMELNASDTRSKKALDEELTGAVDSTVLDFGACGVRGACFARVPGGALGLAL
jgi:replication factor C subunit 1